MKYIILFFINLGLLSSCQFIDPKEDPVVLEYDNILIYSDLSNRIVNNPNDIMVINQLVNYFLDDCVKPGIKVNDRSSINFSKINTFQSECPPAKIDISEIKSLKEKQLFVNNKSKLKGLNKEISEFKNNISCNYLEKDKGGLDILSLIYNEINNGVNIKKPTFIKNENDTTTIKYYNQLFIFTDGYLEYSTKGGDSSFYFGNDEIEKVRSYCKLNKISPENAIKNNSSFKIRPLRSENNKFINLYIMETYDRGLNKQKGTLKNTGDLSDNNILRIVWDVWATESGFRHIVWKQMTGKSSLSKSYIKSLILH